MSQSYLPILLLIRALKDHGQRYGILILLSRIHLKPHHNFIKNYIHICEMLSYQYEYYHAFSYTMIVAWVKHDMCERSLTGWLLCIVNSITLNILFRLFLWNM